MRKKWDEQLSIFHIFPKNKIARELEAISEILDASPQILDTVYKDLLGTHLLFRHFDLDEVVQHMERNPGLDSFADCDRRGR